VAQFCVHGTGVAHDRRTKKFRSKTTFKKKIEFKPIKLMEKPKPKTEIRLLCAYLCLFLGNATTTVCPCATASKRDQDKQFCFTFKYRIINIKTPFDIYLT
jgi:hypothetical protein